MDSLREAVGYRKGLEYNGVLGLVQSGHDGQPRIDS